MTSKMLLFGLMVQCPFGEKNYLAHCPLKKYRESLSLEEKYESSSQLDSLSVEEMLRFHSECYRARTAKLHRNIQANRLGLKQNSWPKEFPNLDSGSN